MEKSTSPNVTMFQEFQKKWPQIDTKDFSCAADDLIKTIDTDHIVKFCELRLLETQPRDDYRELLQLSILFLGGKVHSSFRIPGPVHHARWMAKAIYCLKIYLFRSQFNISSDLPAIEKICLFIVSVYIEAWYLAPEAVKAPSVDLKFIRKIVEFEKIDKEISQAACRKFINHLWYLSEEAVGLAFFDETLPENVRVRMAKALGKNYEEEKTKKYTCKVTELRALAKKELDYFVSTETKSFFERFEIDTSFLSDPPSSWNSNETFLKSKKKIQHTMVVNDTAERGVKLIQEYNTVLTKSEDQRQFIVQIVKDYRTKFPDCKKRTLVKS